VRSAERPSLVLCHWSFAKGREQATGKPPEAGRPGNRKPAKGGEAEGQGNCQNGRRRPMAGNRDSGAGEPAQIEDSTGRAGRPAKEAWRAGRGTGKIQRHLELETWNLELSLRGTWNPPQAGRLWNLKLATGVLT
jgi:hypothetical protein